MYNNRNDVHILSENSKIHIHFVGLTFEIWKTAQIDMLDRLLLRLN